MKRLIEIPYLLAVFLVSISSRTMNAVFFGGSMYQTFSARCHRKAEQGDADWTHRRKMVNALFFWQEDHCKGALEAENERARETLDRNSGI